MTAPPHFDAGNIVVQTILFEPAAGAPAVAVANVTCKLRKADTTEVNLTTSVVEVLDDLAAPIPNTFSVDWASAETDIGGVYRMRWESNTPSPRIVVDDLTTAFWLDATTFATP